MVSYIVRMRFAPEDRETVSDMLRELALASRQEPGCLTYTVHRHIDDPRRFFIYEQYRDAAEAFLAVSTKYETTARAPDALLRLGQSLAALGEKEAACASLGEVLRKYPRASASVNAVGLEGSVMAYSRTFGTTKK